MILKYAHVWDLHYLIIIKLGVPGGGRVGMYVGWRDVGNHQLEGIW